MPRTYEPIARQVLSSTAASVTFSSIPSTYTDLVIIFNGQFDGTNRQLSMRMNGDTGSNYTRTAIGGNGTVAESVRNANETEIFVGYMPTANAQLTSIIHVMNYANTTTFKTVLARSNDAAAYVSASVGMRRNTAAVTSITLNAYNGNFNNGSTFTLYGILKA
jgi:hypothetical protein